MSTLPANDNDNGDGNDNDNGDGRWLSMQRQRWRRRKRKGGNGNGDNVSTAWLTGPVYEEKEVRYQLISAIYDQYHHIIYRPYVRVFRARSSLSDTVQLMAIEA